jgi:hypothetical protein
MQNRLSQLKSIINHINGFAEGGESNSNEIKAIEKHNSHTPPPKQKSSVLNSFINDEEVNDQILNEDTTEILDHKQ